VRAADRRATSDDGSSIPGYSGWRIRCFQLSMESLLLVDDDADTLEALKAALQREGYAVTAVRNSKVALSLLKSTPFDILVTDGYMPDVTGYELALETRGLQPKIKRFLISGFYESEDVAKSLFSGHLKKPIDIEELLALIAR
jgi:two-component system CheB/CheR fusion protein